VKTPFMRQKGGRKLVRSKRKVDLAKSQGGKKEGREG